jgi:hypothetical protein
MRRPPPLPNSARTQAAPVGAADPVRSDPPHAAPRLPYRLPETELYIWLALGGLTFGVATIWLIWLLFC